MQMMSEPTTLADLEQCCHRTRQVLTEFMTAVPPDLKPALEALCEVVEADKNYLLALINQGE